MGADPVRGASSKRAINSPVAQKLRRGARAAADEVDVVITRGFFLDHDDNCRPIPRGVGERLTLQRRLAGVLIAEGTAERAVP